LVREENKIYYRQIINKAFNESGIYNDPEITLKKFSAFTEIPYSYLSDFINQEYGLTFRELINKYRIKDAKQLIANNHNKRQTFIEIAYEVGFNSKSTFNLAFKKHVGMSPSEFSDSIKKES
jgi:AraC-like DNA-binding protein